MKPTKKILAFLTAVIIALCSFSVAVSAVDKSNELKFNNGKFKILVLSDIQDTNTPQKATTDLMNKAIDRENPDLIVLTGDNIAGWWKNVTPEETKQAVDNVAKAINDKGIPFALVFGNHDHEGLCDEANKMEEEEAKKLIMSWFREYDNCLAVNGEEMTGVGNYNLTVKDSAGEKDIFNLWFMDSNPYSDEEEGGGYGYVHPDQIEWYERKSNELKAANGGKPLNSIVFQHIVVPEVYEMFTEVSRRTKGAVKGSGGFSDKYFVTDPQFIYDGSLNEGPCPANKANAGQFESWVKQGDVIGAVFGHDHINTFSGEYKGIKLMAAPAVTFYSYGNNRGVRTITLDESNLSDLQSEVIRYTDIIDYEIKNPYIRNHGYIEYKNNFLPAVFGSIAGLVVLAVAVTVIVKISKKRKGK